MTRQKHIKKRNPLAHSSAGSQHDIYIDYTIRDRKAGVIARGRNERLDHGVENIVAVANEKLQARINRIVGDFT